VKQTLTSGSTKASNMSSWAGGIPCSSCQRKSLHPQTFDQTKPESYCSFSQPWPEARQSSINH